MSPEQATGVSPAEARAIAREPYPYGFPLVDNYRIMHAYYIDSTSKEFKATWNQVANIPRVFTPDDKAVQSPNSDTPYSWISFDLRAELVVLTMPAMEKDLPPFWPARPLIRQDVAAGGNRAREVRTQR
jgi:hypothetical protein